MPAPISVIVPSLNAAEELPGCLAALMEGLEAGLIRELVLSDGGSQDATVSLAEEAGATVVVGPASRGGQLRRGCARAKGDWLLILHADTQLHEGWSRVVAEHLREGQGSPAYFQLRFRANGVMPGWVAGWANLRARLFALPYGDQGLLITRAVYEAAGGYPDQPLMEDVALVSRLNGIVALKAVAATGAERYQRNGWLRRGSRNLWTLARYLFGRDPVDLAQRYQK